MRTCVQERCHAGGVFMDAGHNNEAGGVQLQPAEKDKGTVEATQMAGGVLAAKLCRDVDVQHSQLSLSSVASERDAQGLCSCGLLLPTAALKPHITVRGSAGLVGTSAVAAR
jgi:hypothetical protein